MGTGLAVRVEEAGFGDKTGLGVKDRGLEHVGKTGVIVRMGPDGETMYCKL